MSPWVTDPDGLTSHYERPKGQKAKPRSGSLAALADEFNQRASLPPEVESFGAKMARLKREKAARAQEQADANATAAEEAAWEDDQAHAQVEDTTNDGAA